MIITVIIGQINKNMYDGYGQTFVESLLTADAYIDVDILYLYNNICMLADCGNVGLGAISLLKYTVMAVP